MDKELFYKKEIRRGFTISEVMKRSWAADLKILDEMLKICDQLNVNMFACYGTLLGAVREHGYIPWDDDLDIGLLGEDYVKFIDTIANNYSDRYQIFNPYTRAWYKMNFSHIVNSREVSFEREHLEEWCRCPLMTGLDVYPYYYIPRNKDDEEFILSVLEKIDGAIALFKQSETLDAGSNILDVRKRLDEALAIKLVELQHLTGCSFSSDRPLDNQLEILYDQVCRIPDEQSSDYVTRYDEYAKNRNKKYPKEYFEHIVYLPFEYAKMPCPIGYDEVLRKRFGGQFIVPRQEKGAHDYPYYRKQLSDKVYYEEEIRRKIQIDILPVDSAKDINDPCFKAHKKRRLYHTGVYELLIYGDTALSAVSATLDEIMDKKDGVELWWMPDMFIKTDDFAMDMVVPSLIEDYEAIIRKYADKGVKLLNVSGEYDTLLSCFNEYCGDPGLLADLFKKAGKRVVLQEHAQRSVNEQKDTVRREASSEYPSSWEKVIEKPDGKRKKIVVYIIDSSVLFQNREKIIDKIRSVLETFRANSENIALIWKPYLPTEDDAVVFGVDFVNRINEMIEEFRDGGWGILDTSDDPEAAINIADAVYGDSDYVIAKCMERGLPAMIQNPDIL